MDRNEILELFAGKIQCSQIVVGQWVDELGLDKETVLRMAGPFGGGCFHGEVCGCVAGALMVIGAEYGHFEWGDEEGNARMIEKIAGFKERFVESCGSLVCRELTGFDFSVPGAFDQAKEAGVFVSRCPNYVNAALEILDDIM